MIPGYVLVVDDLESNRDVLEMGLELAGYTVKTADTGLKALAMARQAPPDLMLLDVMMPALNGYETCKTFKADDSLRDIPIIFVSALSESVDKVLGFEAGGVDFLSKPVEMAEVLARVNAHITLYRQHKEIEQLLIERTVAEQAEHEARMMINALLDNLSALISTLNVNEILERVLSNVGQVVAFDGAFLLQCHDNLGRITHSRGLQSNQGETLVQTIPLDGIDLLEDMRFTHQPIIIGDTELDPRWIQVDELASFRSFLGCPIFAGDEILGTINLLSKTPQFFDQSAAVRLQAFALNVGLALRNARLHEKSQELAVLKERQRLARELHDSVTQTLFAANTIAETLPQHLVKNPPQAVEYSHELVRLTRGATAEMRTLLFELRPEAIIQTPMAILIHQMATACAGKTDADVAVICDEHIILPPETHLVCYRVSQEALNNIVKHSDASRVTVTFHCTPQGFELSIWDNGKGFDPGRVGADHMGLHFMRERAATIQAELHVESARNNGTHISLRGAAQ